MQPELIALLIPEPGQSDSTSSTQVTAIVRSPEGSMEVRQLRPDRSLLGLARLAGRFNCGKPIVDPVTREVVGYEIEPLALANA